MDLPGRGPCGAVWLLRLLILTLLLLLLGHRGVGAGLGQHPPRGAPITAPRSLPLGPARRASLTCRDSWKDEAWYCAYLAMVVWERELSQGQICRVPVRSQFSSEGCCTCVRTSTVCSPLASTSVLVEKRPKSAREDRAGRRGRGRGQGAWAFLLPEPLMQG